jgi:predicted small integral membrane protein
MENSLFFICLFLILAKFRAKENAGPAVHIVLAFRRRAVADGDAFVV